MAWLPVLRTVDVVATGGSGGGGLGILSLGMRGNQPTVPASSGKKFVDVYPFSR